MEKKINNFKFIENSNNLSHVNNCNCISCSVYPEIWLIIGRSLCNDLNYQDKPTINNNANNIEKNYLIEKFKYGKITVINLIRKIEKFLNNFKYKYKIIHQNNQNIEYQITVNECDNIDNEKKISVELQLELETELFKTNLLKKNISTINFNINYKKITVNKILLKYYSCYDNNNYQEHITNIKNFFNKNN